MPPVVSERPLGDTRPRSCGVPRLRTAAFASLCILGLACARSDETARIRQLIADGAVRAERGDLDGLLALAADGFRADPGNRSGGETREVLGAAFAHYRRFQVLHPEPTVTLAEDGRAAAAALPFLIVREERSYPGMEDLYRDPQSWLEKVGENADLYHLSLELVETEKGWRVARARLRSYRGRELIQ